MSDQSLINEVNGRLSDEKAAGASGAVMTGHHQRVGNIARLFPDGTRRSPFHHFVPESAANQNLTVGQSGSDYGYARGSYGALEPDNYLGVGIADVVSKTASLTISADADLFGTSGCVLTVTGFVSPITCARTSPGSYSNTTDPNLAALNAYLGTTIGVGNGVIIKFNSA